MKRFSYAFVFLLFSLIACRKLVEIPAPTTSITTLEAFSDSASATSAIAGIYTNLINTSGTIYFGSGAVTLYAGLSADELAPFIQSDDVLQFYTNTLQNNNGSIYFFLWSQPYTYIYQTNASLEALLASKTLAQPIKNRLIGEVKFLRAFLYFYLVNFYGDVPLVLSSDWTKTKSTPRSPKELVYQQITDDLKAAQALLPDDFTLSGGQRIRANKWAATALLARVFLYGEKWVEAENHATGVINNSLFSLNLNLSEVFLSNNQEAIFQLQQNWKFYPYNITTEGNSLIPYDRMSNPSYYLTKQLLNSFEPNDQRKLAWTDSTSYEGSIYFFPYKYKEGPAQMSVNSIPNEYYTVMRLAEQYLIRAEARARQNKLADAVSDINVIRRRAGLGEVMATNQSDLLAMVAQERRIELFSEWGHRWFDLKRTGLATTVLKVIDYKQPWNPNQLLYPIPFSELKLNASLTQNAGY